MEPKNRPYGPLMSSAEANTFNALRWPEGWGAHQVASSAVGRRATTLGVRLASAPSASLQSIKEASAKSEAQSSPSIRIARSGLSLLMH
jgi:hypothetical protein